MLESALELHPEALSEALAGYAWYLERSSKAADLFFSELDRGIKLVLEAPNRWPIHLHGARRFVLTKFPYSIVYRASEDRVVVYAFAHAKKRPGYWKERLGQADPRVM